MKIHPDSARGIAKAINNLIYTIIDPYQGEPEEKEAMVFLQEEIACALIEEPENFND